jgi:hypothetical protein
LKWGGDYATMHPLAPAGGVPRDVRSGGARRFVEQRSTQRARVLSQRQQPDEPQRQHRVSCVLFVPHFSPLFNGAGAVTACCERPHRQVRHGMRFRNWPPITVCGPRQRAKNGAGESRPHSTPPMAPLSGTYQSEAPPERALRCLICCASSRPASGLVPPP